MAFITLGCAKNEVDSERMRALVASAGLGLVDDPSQADCVVINTCAFITEATEEAIATILEAAELPSVASGRAKLVVVGCLPSRYGDELADELPEVAAFMSVDEQWGLADLVKGLFGVAGAAGSAAVRTGDGSLSSSPAAAAASSPAPLRLPAEARPWAYLKIAEGCSRRCSYCTIPDIRGPYRPSPLAEVLAEAAELVDAGARELVLIAQDTGLWHDGELRLPGLLAELARLYPDTWLRVMYLQPSGVTDELLAVMAAHANICNYLDIPLQHASARLLAEMNRSGSGEEFLELVEKIRGVLPDVTLRTTLIAGFPGETRAEARELERFVEAAEFDYVGVFAYSQEAGTPAGQRDDQVDPRTRRARAQRLRDLADAISYRRAEAQVGRITEVLACGYEDGMAVGRSQAQAPDVDGIVRFVPSDTDSALDDMQFAQSITPGQRLKVEIVDSFQYDWDGKVIIDERG